MKNFKQLLIGVIIIVLSTLSQAQDGVGIGTNQPDNSAVLHVKSESNNKGILIPETDDLVKIGAPAEGLMVYNTTENSFYFYSAGWQRLGTPKGGIIMWSGSTPPAGWVLCDNREYDTNGNATAGGGVFPPDLRGRFIVGYHPGDTDYDDPGNMSTGGTATGETGGARHVILTAAQSGLRSHDHSASSSPHSHTHGFSYTGATGKTVGKNSGGGEAGADDAALSGTTNSSNHSHTITVGTVTAQNASHSHENRPPYYTLAFIMKL